MNDMRSVIVPRSDQLNSDDLIGGPITITISRVDIKAGEQPVSIFFAGDNGKPFKCCKSMARVMVACWGPDANKYVGRSMTLYRDPNVKWAGMAVGGIRISHMTDIDGVQTMALTETKGSRKPFTVKPLKAAPVATTSDPATDKADRWLASLAKKLDAATTTDEVHTVKARPDVQTTLANAPDAFKARINAAFLAALKRLEPADAEDDGFPGTPTPDDDAEMHRIAQGVVGDGRVLGVG